MRWLICLCLLLLVGCETRSREEKITTPLRRVACPVCGETATLWRFTQHDADYKCPNHQLTFDRRAGYFESAMPIDKPQPGVEATSHVQ
jgi:predicted RNA-binding Zn-ribbon protein involved in translation (DUF1610 family)